jgi:hypothetical protein
VNGNIWTNVFTLVTNLDFPNTLAFTNSDLILPFIGKDGDEIIVGEPAAAHVGGGMYRAFSSNTVTYASFVNFCAIAINPSSATFRFTVIRH